MNEPSSVREDPQFVSGVLTTDNLIYDETGVEVFNWTTLDVAVERAAED
jgi:hypothetical protein